MISIDGMQTCYKCKKMKHHSEFYEKGSRYMSCSACRSERSNRKESLESLLKRDRQLNPKY